MEINSLRASVKMVFALAIALVPCVLIAAFVVGGNYIWAVSVSLCFLVFGALMARGQRLLTTIGAALALMGQAIALNGAFQGHAWQIDSHMLYFALLASLVILRSIPALLFAAAIIALHHASLSVLMPSLIYPTGGLWENIERTLLHAGIVVLETVALVITVLQLVRLERATQLKTNELLESLAVSDAARKEAQLSQKQAEEAKQDAQQAQERAEATVLQLEAAEVTRQSAEIEKHKIQKNHDERDKAKSQEQALVVEALRIALRRLGTGDLTARISRSLPKEYDELRDGFNAAVRSLEEMVSEVATRSMQMDAEIHEISMSTNDLALQTEQQAMTLGSTSLALGALTRIVKENADSVDEVNGSSQSAQLSAKQSGEIVSDASVAMQLVMGEAQEIAKIVEVIDAISFQTNLLALNAGVEAARAGDAGRGFAVVASEVRALAQRSAESATDIRTIISRSEEQVARGSNKISDSVSALEKVVAAVQGITERMELIAGSTQQQSVEISSVNASVGDLGAATQRNAAQFEQTNAACLSLAQNASTLRELTERFKTAKTEMENWKVA
ncbi:methyl-accepting chemotaxis protein [Sulfitobacter sp. AS59]|uniref:methyl-accepting chemotaxis protein n=1 Tax=Sulfitobacter sp. AS59 TaxID=3135784 RepID=UPI00317EC51F